MLLRLMAHHTPFTPNAVDVKKSAIGILAHCKQYADGRDFCFSKAVEHSYGYYLDAHWYLRIAEYPQVVYTARDGLRLVDEYPEYRFSESEAYSGDCPKGRWTSLL